jgi:Cu/Ag efflux protein CusF
MKKLKDILDEARMVASAGYRISPSGRKVRRVIKVGDDSYNKADDVDKDGDVDADDMKRLKMMAKEEVEQLDEISDKTLSNYVAAARKDREHNKINKSAPDTAQKASANARDKKRIAGMNKAKAYLTPGTAGHATNQRRRAANEETNLEEATVKKANYSWGKMMTVHHGADHSYPLHPEHQEAIKNLKHDEKTHFKDETGTKVTAHREGDEVHFTSNRTAKKTTVSHSHFTESTQYTTFTDFINKK